MTAAKRLSPPLVLDDCLIKEVVASVSSLFKTSFSIKVQPGHTEISTDHAISGDISGIMGMVQEKMEGTLTVSFPQDTIFSILELVYPDGFSEINDTVKEGVGEITNTVFGAIKTNLNDKGYHLKMAIPNVVVGSNHTVHNIHHGKSMLISFESEKGPFGVTITLQEI